jgi:FtsZ-binding cell division protein ZapB
MAKINLKRIVKRGEVTNLLDLLIERYDLRAGIYDPNGKLLYGHDVQGLRFPVMFEGESVGEVRGDERAGVLTSMLELLVFQDLDKKTVVNEALTKYKEITLLYGMAEKVAGRVKPREIGQLVLEGALRLIEADRASVMLLDDRGETLEILAALGEDIPVGVKVRANWGIFQPVLESRRAEVINNAPEDPRFEPGAIKVGSLILAPLTVSDQVIGLLYITSEEPRIYTSEDLRLISALATQAAAAIETTRLIQNLEDKVAARTRDLRKANEKLREEIEERVQAQNRLQEELNEAADYVRSLLPPPILEGVVRTDWRFTPTTSLGGDSFGYHWLDDDRFAMYLLDVSGHGVGAALLSVSAMNVLRSRNLPQTDFSEPDQVLSALNNAFPMEEQNGRYFTMWYGVYNKKDRRLAYASGGHPPALLIGNGRGNSGVERLVTKKMFIGGNTARKNALSRVLAGYTFSAMAPSK